MMPFTNIHSRDLVIPLSCSKWFLRTILHDILLLQAFPYDKLLLLNDFLFSLHTKSTQEGSLSTQINDGKNYNT